MRCNKTYPYFSCCYCRQLRWIQNEILIARNEFMTLLVGSYTNRRICQLNFSPRSRSQLCVQLNWIELSEVSHLFHSVHCSLAILLMQLIKQKNDNEFQAFQNVCENVRHFSVNETLRDRSELIASYEPYESYELYLFRLYTIFKVEEYVTPASMYLSAAIFQCMLLALDGFNRQMFYFVSQQLFHD